MRNTIVIIFALIPFFVLGQDGNFNSGYLPIDDVPQIKLADHASTTLYQPIETTLIDDREIETSLVEFDLNKQHSLSFTEKNQGIFKFDNDQKSQNEQLFEVEPLLDPKLNFKNKLLRKGYF